MCDPKKAGYMGTPPVINWALGWLEIVDEKVVTFHDVSELLR